MTAVTSPSPSPQAPAAATRPRHGWRFWLYNILVAAAAGWLCFVLLHLLISGRWWFWLIIDVMPPAVLLIVPVLLAAGAAPCRRSRRPVALLSLAALVIGAPISGLNFRALAGGDGPAPPGALRVFSWNTEYWDSDGGPFYDFLRDQHADVYLLQEYLRDGDIPGRIDDSSRLRAEFPGYDLAIAGELVTLSRLPIVRSYPLPAAVPTTDTGWLGEYTRDKILRTDLSLAGGHQLSIYNLHMPVQINPTSPFSAAFYRTIREQRAQREPQWRALAADVAANPGPALVAGDFNTTPAMGDLNKVPSRLRDASTALPDLYPTTYRDRPGLPRWWRLDWAFVTRDVRVHDYTFGSSHGQSDHRFQLLQLSTAP
ncbi:endonuclease/exonuclease/phosphatase family protein [Dactylosporangium sp. CA-092794]|uniref:endonuclease/exonuclease/phosphatase family protein n=1 Tax=Dactylosporangium sp. CA-092794 TaxID=3239929 RepID=UPI003D8D7933